MQAWQERQSRPFSNNYAFWTPRRLCDLSHNIRVYPGLRLDSLAGVQDEWAAYVETTFRDIRGLTHLVEWWDSRPSSALMDYVSFLTTVMGTGSVERFFSFAKYTDVLWFACVHGTPEIHSMHGTPQGLTASIKLAIQGHGFGKNLMARSPRILPHITTFPHIIPHFYHICFYCCLPHNPPQDTPRYMAKMGGN